MIIIAMQLSIKDLRIILSVHENHQNYHHQSENDNDMCTTIIVVIIIIIVIIGVKMMITICARVCAYAAVRCISQFSQSVSSNLMGHK